MNSNIGGNQKNTSFCQIDKQFLRLALTGVVVVLGGSFHFGYQISLINPLADVLQEFLEQGLKQNFDIAHLIKDESALRNALWASIAGILFAGSLFGAIAAPLILENIGAKRSFLISSLVLCLSFSLAAAAKVLYSPLMFILARFISGVGIGLITTVQTVYLTEISPVKHRGFMGTLTGFATSIGFFVASGVGLPQVLGSPTLWHWAYIIEMLPSFILVIVMLFFLSESPVYSMRQGNNREALFCISLYHSLEDHEARVMEISREILKSSLQLPSFYTKDANVIKKDDFNSCHTGFIAIINSRSARNALLICMLLNATVSFSGILAVSFFGTFLLQGIGFSESSAALANCFASFSGILGNIAGSYTIDKIGRRKLIIGGLSTLTILNVILMVLVFLFQSSTNINLGYGFLAIFMAFLFAFSCGVGPMAWFLATELSTSVNRSHVQSLSVSCQYATCFLSPLLFFPFYQSAGAYSFLIFIFPLLFTATYLYVYLPETKNRTIEQIIKALNDNNVSATNVHELINEQVNKIPIQNKKNLFTSYLRCQFRKWTLCTSCKKEKSALSKLNVFAKKRFASRDFSNKF